MPMTIAVVGAGPAGCAAARRLDQLGYEVVVFEAQSAVGGRTRVVKQDGFKVPTGAIFMMDTYTETLGLLSEMNRMQDVRRWKPVTGLEVDGRLHKVRFDRPLSYLRSSVLSAPSKLRLTRAVASILLRPGPHPFDLAGLAAADAGEDLAAWSARTMPGELYEYVVRPYMETFYAVSPRELSVSFQVGNIKQGHKVDFFVPTEGMGGISEWLAEGLDVRLGTPVKHIERDGAGARVHLDGDTLAVDGVVVATPAPTAAALVGDLFGQEVTDALTSARYTPITHVLLGYNRDLWPDFPVDLVVPVGPGERVVGSVLLNARAFPSCVPSGGQLVSVYFNGPPSAFLPPSEAGAQSREAVARHLGRAPEPDYQGIFAHDRGLTTPGPGHYATMLALRAAIHGPVRLAGDYFVHAGVEAAVRSAHTTVDELHRELSRSSVG